MQAMSTMMTSTMQHVKLDNVQYEFADDGVVLLSPGEYFQGEAVSVTIYVVHADGTVERKYDHVPVIEGMHKVSE